MLKGHFKKLLVIFSGAIFFSVFMISNLYAQEKTTTVETDKIKSILLRQEGWTAEWHCSYWPFDTLNDLVFEKSGKKIVVKIHNSDSTYTYTSCKRKVKIKPNGFTMAGCNEGTIHLVFDPDDNRYPFKGDNKSCILKLTAK